MSNLLSQKLRPTLKKAWRMLRPLKISVVIPNYNHGQYLRDNIEGLLAQTYPHWELHIVEDGSTDGSVEMIKAYAVQDARIKPVYFEKNQGAVVALKVALDRCRGALLYGSAADDFIANPRFFEMAISALGQHPYAAGFFARSSVVHAETLEEKWVMGSAPIEGFNHPKDSLEAFLHARIFIPGVSAIWRRALIERCGGFDAALGPQCDYFVNHALPAMEGVVFSNEVVTVTRHIAESYSNVVDNTVFFQRHALVEKKIRALPLAYEYSQQWLHVWREHVINGRLAVSRQADFIQVVRNQLESIEAWERASLPPLFISAIQQFLETVAPVERELNQKLEHAHQIFNEQSGLLESHAA